METFTTLLEEALESWSDTREGLIDEVSVNSGHKIRVSAYCGGPQRERSRRSYS